MSRVSVITSVFNGMPFLPQAIASVAGQGGDVDHVVIDAGSTDGTLEWLQGQTGFRLVEQPGMPLYEAWNLGLEMAHGEWVGFVNADDWLPMGALSRVQAAIAAFPGAEAICGRARALDENGVELCRYATDLSIERLSLAAPAINAMFIRRDRLMEDDGFRTRWRLAGDRERLLRLALSARPPVAFAIDDLLYCYRVHARSQTLWQDPRRRQAIGHEHLEVIASLQTGVDGSEGARGVMRRWRAKERAALALGALKRGEFASCARMAAAAWSETHRFPVEAFLAWRQGRRLMA